jgi:hypothetical protein
MLPFFSYYGSKWRLAKHYPPPLHDVVFEPFAGSAGYSTRHHEHSVRLSDVDPVVVGVWEYLIRTSSREILDLPAPVDSVDDLHACPEARWLVGFWLGRAMAKPRRTISAWGRTRRWPLSFWGAEVRDRIARQVDLVRHWRISQCSYEDVASERATWFCDPPYERQGRHYKRSRVDYQELSRWARGLPGQVLVCENEGATWLPFRAFRVAAANSSRGSGRVSREVLWTHDDADAGRAS